MIKSKIFNDEQVIKSKLLNGESIEIPDHSRLINLDFEHSGHTGFQRSEEGKGLSTNDYTDEEKAKLDEALSKAEEAESIAKQASKALSFENYQDFIETFNSEPIDKYMIGQSIFIATGGIPDIWIYGISGTNIPYDYTTDEEFAEAIKTSPIQVGFYFVSYLETEKVILTDYIKNTDYPTTTRAGVIKKASQYGTNVTSNGELTLVAATTNDINNKSNSYRPIVSSTIDYSTMKALTDPLKYTWTEDDKSNARNTLGASSQEDVSNKLDKVSTTSGRNRARVYAVNDSDGRQVMMEANYSITPTVISRWDSGGRLSTNTPTADSHCVNKQYVDKLIGDIETLLSEV